MGKEKNNNEYFLLSVNVDYALLISNISPGFVAKSEAREMHCGCWGASEIHCNDILFKMRNVFV